MSDDLMEFHIHAEHCPGPFYMGWWLYVDPVVDGKPYHQKYTGVPRDGRALKSATWRLTSQLLPPEQLPRAQHYWLGIEDAYSIHEQVRAIAAVHGVHLPSPVRYDQRVARTVGVVRPQGFRVLAHNYLLHDWCVPDWLIQRERTRRSCWRYGYHNGRTQIPLVYCGEAPDVMQPTIWEAVSA